MTRLAQLVVIEVGVIFVSALVVCGAWAARAERQPEISCKIRDALPLLRDVREFLRDPEAPADVRGFKAQMAWQNDWDSRRDVVAQQVDALIAECERDLAEMRGE